MHVSPHALPREHVLQHFLNEASAVRVPDTMYSFGAAMYGLEADPFSQQPSRNFAAASVALHDQKLQKLLRSHEVWQSNAVRC